MAGGGVAPYSYLWTAGQTTVTANGMCSGTHNIFVEDANLCATFATVVIGEPDQLGVIDSIIDVSCSGDADGAVYLTVTGGTPFFTYGWTPNAGNGPIITNLTAQAYNVTIQDMNGCVINETYNVVEPTPLAYNTALTNSYCTGANGVASVAGSGGTLPYTFLWPDGQTTATATNLVAGVTYNFELSDANGCMVIVPITVGDDAGPVISMSSTEVQCFGNDDGTATVTIDAFGTPPFTYQWDDPLSQNTATAGALPGNMTYNVIVTDDNGCTATAPVFVSENPEMTLITLGDATICYGDAVLISVTGSGGFAINDYFYDWSHGLPNQQTHLVSPTTTTTYTVDIVDDLGCRSTASGAITVEVLPQLAVTATDFAICEGDDAMLIAAATGGSGGPYIYSWNTGANGDTIIITGLTTGLESYQVTVTDACPQAVTVNVDVTIHPVPDVTFTVTGEGCEPFVLTAAVATGGGAPPIVDWFWDFGDGGTSTDPGSTTHLYTVAGTYFVTLIVISDMGCPDTIVSLTPVNAYGLPVAGFDITQDGIILDPAETTILSPTVDFVSTATEDSDSTVTITEWFWDFGDPNSGADNNSTDENPSHMYNDTGTYVIMQIVTTSEGCIDTIWDTLVVVGDYIIFAPNSFTPDGDEKNDFFFPKGIGVDGSSFELYIFDRWGDLIATVTGVWSDDISIGWDGRANQGGEEAQIDVYVWLIRTEDFRGENHEYVGHVTLLR